MKRNLYLNVQDKETALQNFLSAFEDISPKKEWIPVTESLGRITAEASYARYSSQRHSQ